jgi:hypothetical protein
LYPTLAVLGSVSSPWYVRGVPIVGERPESGVRITIERDKAQHEPPWRYEGAAHVPDDSFPIAVTVDADGTVAVAVQESASRRVPPPSDLAEKVRLIVRTAYRQASADGEPPAWRLVRWRGEK